MSDKNIGKQLTLQLIVAKTKSNNLDSIKNLNLWGNELEDLSILQKMPNLQVISLSVNKISSLKDFRHCYKLQELYLRKNCILDIKEIKYIMKLPSLKVLWLHDNPCAQVRDQLIRKIQNYRQIVIRHLPNLGKLDNNPITPQQKAASMAFKQTIMSYNEQQQKQQAKKQKKQNVQYTKQPIYQKQQKPMGTYQQKGGYQPVQKQVAPSSNIDPTKQMNRNKNILMAVLSLMRQLDGNSLQIVRRQAQSMLNQGY